MRFSLSPLFSDHAVLCRGKPIRIFGTAGDDADVCAILTGPDGQVLGGASSIVENGAFLCTLPPQKACCGCQLTVRCGSEEIVRKDICVGEVFMAGGQSNMEMKLYNADEGPQLCGQHRNDAVRYCNIPHVSLASSDAVPLDGACWRSIEPGMGGDFSAAAYFFAMRLQQILKVPVGVIVCCWGGTSISCWLSEDALQENTESAHWVEDYSKRIRGITMEEYLRRNERFRKGMADWDQACAAIKQRDPSLSASEIYRKIGPAPWCPPDGPASPFRPCGLYTSMLRPCAPYTLSGFLFYQGESDAGATVRYDLLLCSLIRQVRHLFRDMEMPFLNVQLPMWRDPGSGDTGHWALLRHQQLIVQQQITHTALVILLDQGDRDNLHPTAKRVVGERLADEALRLIYGQPRPSSPYALYAYADRNRVHVCFSAPVTLRGKDLSLFALAGTDGHYCPADNVRQDTADELSFSCADIPAPASVRYAWVDYAPSVPLWGMDSLPAAPFCLPV